MTKKSSNWPIDQFFQSSLYNTPDTNLSIPANAVRGNGKKNVAILTHQLKQQLSFLSKIMGAAKLDIQEDCILFDLDALPKCNWAFMQKTWTFENVLVFGFAPSELQLHLKIPKYTLQKWQQATFLFADALEDIAADKFFKKRLWEQLQLLF